MRNSDDTRLRMETRFGQEPHIWDQMGIDMNPCSVIYLHCNLDKVMLPCESQSPISPVPLSLEVMASW